MSGTGTTARLRRLLRERAGLTARHLSDHELIRLARRAVGAEDDPEALADRIGADFLSWERLLALVTVGETYFLRGGEQIAALREHLLPRLVEARRDVRRLRLWSAGCATGEEAYSLAMLLAELPGLAGWDVVVLGTDVNPAALDVARAGRYTSWSLRGVSPAAVERHLHREGREHVVDPALRARVRFAAASLTDPRDPTGGIVDGLFDLVLCRNVLMYLDPRVVPDLLHRIAARLAPDGALLVSPSEWHLPTAAGLASERVGAAVAFRGGVPADPGGAGRRVDLWDPAPPLPGLDLTGPVAPGRAPASRSGNGRPPAPRAAGLTALLADARRSASEGRLDDADRALDRILDLEPLSAPAHLLRALVLQERGRPDDALAHLRRCLYADPELLIGRFALGALLRQLGRHDRAAAELRRLAAALAAHPHDLAVPHGDDLTVRQLAGQVRAHLATLEEVPV
jgi:chemotaxis protein methyltransferase CheR